jgi:hypothetical protein
MKKKPPVHDIYDNWELFKPLIFAAVVTWIPFSIIEIYIPAVEKQVRYEKECEAKGGFVYEKQNEEKRCIKKDYITIPL